MIGSVAQDVWYGPRWQKGGTAVGHSIFADVTKLTTTHAWHFVISF